MESRPLSRPDPPPGARGSLGLTPEFLGGCPPMELSMGALCGGLRGFHGRGGGDGGGGRGPEGGGVQENHKK